MTHWGSLLICEILWELTNAHPPIQYHRQCFYHPKYSSVLYLFNTSPSNCWQSLISLSTISLFPECHKIGVINLKFFQISFFYLAIHIKVFYMSFHGLIALCYNCWIIFHSVYVHGLFTHWPVVGDIASRFWNDEKSYCNPSHTCLFVNICFQISWVNI